MSNLSPEEQVALEWDWDFWARPNQLVPADDDWRWLYVKSGRGFGKSRMASEWVRKRSEADPKSKLLLIGPTFQFARDNMIEDSDSGILSVCPPWNKPEYFPSRLLLKWPNGAMARGFGADKPDKIRGNNLTGCWLDEFCAWRLSRRKQALLQVRLCLRKGRPQSIVTTTPKPDEDFKELLAKAEFDPIRPTLFKPIQHRLVTGSTYDNEENLSDTFRDEVSDLEGTREGLQELYGQVVDNVDGALFKLEWIQLWKESEMPPVTYKILSLDPSNTCAVGSDNFGMVVVGKDSRGRGFVYDDWSAIMHPSVWAPKALAILQNVDALVFEDNQGGENIEHILRLEAESEKSKILYGPQGPNIPKIYRVTSKTDKRTRAHASTTLYSSSRIFHLKYMPTLVRAMTQWVPGSTAESPGELDALAHGLNHLFPRSKPQAVYFGTGDD